MLLPSCFTLVIIGLGLLPLRQLLSIYPIVGAKLAFSVLLNLRLRCFNRILACFELCYNLAFLRLQSMVSIITRFADSLHSILYISPRPLWHH